MSEAKQPQLQMLLTNLGNLPSVHLPDGCDSRPFHCGDEPVWIDVLNSTGALGEWNLERARQSTCGAVRVVPEGIHFIMRDGVAVATACLMVHDDVEEAELGWVAVSPQHQGKGLGCQVCLVTLHYMRRLGFRSVFLFSDDHRLAAIKTYLRLGFRPRYSHESHSARWRDVIRRLGWAGDILM